MKTILVLASFGWAGLITAMIMSDSVILIIMGFVLIVAIIYGAIRLADYTSEREDEELRKERHGGN